MTMVFEGIGLQEKKGAKGRCFGGGISKRGILKDRNVFFLNFCESNFTAGQRMIVGG